MANGSRLKRFARLVLRTALRIALSIIASHLRRSLDEFRREEQERKRYRKVIRTNWLGFTSTELHER